MPILARLLAGGQTDERIKASHQRALPSSWKIEEVALSNLQAVDEAVRRQDCYFALGPKCVIVQTCLTALMAAEAVWVSYPIPLRYSLDYSIGAMAPQLFRLEGQ